MPKDFFCLLPANQSESKTLQYAILSPASAKKCLPRKSVCTAMNILSSLHAFFFFFPGAQMCFFGSGTLPFTASACTSVLKD